MRKKIVTRWREPDEEAECYGQEDDENRQNRRSEKKERNIKMLF